MLPKCCNLRIGTNLKTISLKTQAMPPSKKYYNEVPVQRNFLFCFSTMGVASHPIPPLPPHKSAPASVLAN